MVRSIGEKKKQQVYNTALFQTKDYEAVKDLVAQLKAEEASLGDAGSEYGLKVKQIEASQDKAKEELNQA